jgi:hypothetical protein
LLDFARSYLSEAFPNPDREGCPPDAALRTLAFHPTESEPTITEHLSVCSPCFRRYGELLAELKSQMEAERRVSWRHIPTWSKAHTMLAGTAIACVLLIAIGAGLLLRRSRLPSTPPVETHRAPGPVEPVSPAIAYSPFSLNLSTVSPARGPESPTRGSQRPVRVPTSPLDLTLTLPLGSQEGTYDVKLTAGGRTLWSKSAQARLHKGKTLIQVEADFRQIPLGLYNLEVQSSTGIRLIQSVSIEPAIPKRGEQER